MKKDKVRKQNPLDITILCKNKQIKKFSVMASKKFVVNDETYVIKKNCCYLKQTNEGYKESLVYFEGNPNPFNLHKLGKNKGLTEREIESYIAGDLFNILIECQMMDKSKYIIHLCLGVFILSFIQFIIYLGAGI